MPEPLSVATLTPLLNKVAGAVASEAKTPLKNFKENVQVYFKRGFEKYVEKQIQRYSIVKTIIGSSVPLQLLDIYVNLSVINGTKLIRDDDLISLSRSKRRVILYATAGAGKSMLMRYLYFRFLRDQEDFLPVFIELRDLNENQDQSILDHTCRRIAESIGSFSVRQLELALDRGMILFLFDGFDEIDFDQRAKRGKEIASLCAKYLHLTCIVSGRPDESFQSWEAFHIYRVADFSKSQVEALINKIPYDADQKAVFLNKLKDGLYETHGTFLRNPLLTLMMLITFDQFVEIPAKIHLFYEHAFQALFGRHDVTKIGFVRKRHVDIALDDYRRLFSYFCVLTYQKQAFSFSVAQTLEYIDKSISASQISVNKKDMLDDLVACTCMLVRDGLDLSFSHRSFQEYFVALFFSRLKSEDFAKHAHKLVSRGEVDNIFLMISEINEETFEEAWALPQISNITGRIKSIPDLSNIVSVAKHLWGDTIVRVFDDRLTLMNENNSATQTTQTRAIPFRVYGVFAKIRENIGFDDDEDKKILEMIASGEMLGKSPRYKQIRSERDYSGFSQKLDEEDNEWLEKSDIKNFIKRECIEMTRLEAEIKDRVEKRKSGLLNILD